MFARLLPLSKSIDRSRHARYRFSSDHPCTHARAATEGCASNEFTCDDGSCISSTLTCDGRRDCRNGEDESFDLCHQSKFFVYCLLSSHLRVWRSICFLFYPFVYQAFGSASKEPLHLSSGDFRLIKQRNCHQHNAARLSIVYACPLARCQFY